MQGHSHPSSSGKPVSVQYKAPRRLLSDTLLCSVELTVSDLFPKVRVMAIACVVHVCVYVCVIVSVELTTHTVRRAALCEGRLRGWPARSTRS